MSAEAPIVAAAAPSAPDSPQVRTLLLTDLCDSTTLVERLGDAAAARLFREHDHLVLDLQQRWRGRLIDRSDGLLLLFERPIDGLGFALDYGRGLRTLGQAHAATLQARAGLHVGEVLTWRNSAAAVEVGAKPLEVEGLAKPMAGRLMTLARPGQILLSATAEPLAHRAARELGERAEHLIWKSWGRWRLKGVPQAQEIFEVGEPGLAPLRAPAQNRAKAWRDIPLWRRPAMLAAELALVAGIAGGAWFATRPQPAIAFGERDWVVVADLRNLTGDKLLDDSLEQAFRISLEQSRYVNVLSDLRARDTLALMQRRSGAALDRATASEIALRDGARAVILPTVAEVGGKVRVSAEVIDPRTQTTVYAASADGSGAASTLGSIDDVTAALRGKLGEALESIEKTSAPLPQVSTSNLDALRAYALGQKAFGRSRYAEADGFYARAIALDPQFALAHLGRLRARNALNDLAGGEGYLRQALALRAKLPPREQTYLEAWAAEVNDPSNALGKWRQMAELYPDFYQASANAGYGLYARNRFAEGVRFARQAISPQSEFVPISWDLLGRLALAQEHHGSAVAAFRTAAAKGASSASTRLADAYAAQRRFTDADRVWTGAGKPSGVPFDRVSILLDEGRWEQALGEARRIQSAAEATPLRTRAAMLPLAAVEWLQGRDATALERLDRIVERAIAAARVSEVRSDAVDDAYLAVAAAMLAQRMGNSALPERVVRFLHDRRDLLAAPPVDGLYPAMEANQWRLAGRPAEAAIRLAGLVDGSEPFAVHAALFDAYAASGEQEKALSEARWLGAHRGRAYSELGSGWCQQAINVADTTLARLRAAELLTALGRNDEARKELRVFDRQWPAEHLPAHLRVRRAALVPTSS